MEIKKLKQSGDLELYISTVENSFSAFHVLSLDTKANRYFSEYENPKARQQAIEYFNILRKRRKLDR
ncbi:hypothetical protein ES703_36321 [subsurface metagenome]